MADANAGPRSEMRGGNPEPRIEWILDGRNVSKEVSRKRRLHSIPLSLADSARLNPTLNSIISLFLTGARTQKRNHSDCAKPLNSIW